MPNFIVKASAPGNAIPSRDYPVLEEGNAAYPLGEYEAVFSKVEGGRSVYMVQHLIRGAPLISRLLKDRSARYACAISSPKSAFRAVRVSDQPSHETRWNEDDLGEPPLFTPMILCFETIEMTLSSERDGVHELWDGCRIQLEKGSRLAVGSVVERETSLVDLLVFKEDPEQKEGSFSASAATDPFRFIVHLHPKLHRYLASANIYRKGGLRENIMTHIVSACFALLQRDFSEDDEEEGWKSHRGLRALAEEMANEGLPLWTDLDNFKPEVAATTLFPHTFNTDDGNGGDE